MNNEKTINEMQALSRDILEGLENRSTREFKINELDFSDGVKLRDMPLEGRALNGIMSTLRVKKNFGEYAKKMTPEDWHSVAQRIKRTEGEIVMYADIAYDEKGEPEIVNVFHHNDRKKHADTSSYRQYFEWLETSLRETDHTFSLKGLSFQKKTEAFDIYLLNDEPTDVIGTGLDLWKTGGFFNFNGLSFNYAPFLERLSCSNGALARNFGFGASISQTKFNDKKISGTIQSAIVESQDALKEQLMIAIGGLRLNNASIAEFYNFRKFFEKRNKDNCYDNILYKFFDDSPFYQAYGLNVQEKSRKWQSTANSGINAYDLYNALTYIASHPDEIIMERNDRVELQIASANFLFKPELDLEDIATSIKVEYPVLEIMK